MSGIWRTNGTLVRFSVATAVLVGAVAIGYAIRSAVAAGIPTNTLSYTGSLLTFGSPDNATHQMSASLLVNGSQVCTSGTVPVTCVNGQFTIPLPSTCPPFIQSNPNVNVQVIVDGTPMGTTPVTAVPYSVVAGNVSASGVTGVLPVANGGTNSSTQNFVDLTSAQSIGGNKTFTGDTALPTAGVGSNATLTLGGVDLFNAVFQGTYPAVIGMSESYGTSSTASLSCGAPSSINFDVPPAANNAFNGIANGWFGNIIFTRGGAFNASQGGTPFNGSCAALCYGPVTFFLNSPTAQTINLTGWMDDGPSPIYVNGAIVVANATGNLVGGAGQNVPIPSGNFALSFVSCSSNGETLAFWIDSQFITQYNLTVNYNATFHRNGQ